MTMTSKDLHIAVKRNDGVEYLLSRFEILDEETLFETVRKIVPAKAEEFIKIAKENELDFRLMLCEELSSYLLIALFSLFLPGFLFTIFLVFKWGFSTGFCLTFLVKYFY